MPLLHQNVNYAEKKKTLTLYRNLHKKNVNRKSRLEHTQTRKPIYLEYECKG